MKFNVISTQLINKPPYGNNNYDDAKQMGDSLELFLLAAFFVGGAPTNLVICFKLCTCKKNRLAWLQMLQHLNYSDLLVLWVYVPTRIITKTYRYWYAGKLLCKTAMFFQTLPFYISSNIIVCIAIDKILSYQSGLQSSRRKRIRNLVFVGWVTALVSSAPQLWWYSVYTDADSRPVCVDAHFPFRMWSFGLLDNATFFAYTEEMKVDWNFIDQFSSIYHIFHLLMIFWLPLLIISFYYGWFVVILIRTKPSHNMSILRRKSSGSQRLRQQGYAKETHYTPAAATRAKVIRTAALLVVLYLICWIPYNLISIWGIVDPTGSDAETVTFLHQLIVLNSVLNPYIYGTTYFLHLCHADTDDTRNVLL